ncbi:MAG: hypothetical protein ACI30I_08590 [Parabacteroides sp.]
MKPLIISFFTALLGYSLFFDQEGTTRQRTVAGEQDPVRLTSAQNRVYPADTTFFQTLNPYFEVSGLQ